MSGLSSLVTDTDAPPSVNPAFIQGRHPLECNLRYGTADTRRSGFIKPLARLLVPFNSLKFVTAFMCCSRIRAEILPLINSTIRGLVHCRIQDHFLWGGASHQSSRALSVDL